MRERNAACMRGLHSTGNALFELKLDVWTAHVLRSNGLTAAGPFSSLCPLRRKSVFVSPTLSLRFILRLLLLQRCYPVLSSVLCVTCHLSFPFSFPLLSFRFCLPPLTLFSK
jgi:hypothetical protein